MSHLEVRGFSISIDGFGAGPDQRPDQPLGAGGEQLHDWLVATRSWQRQHGRGGEGGTSGVDDDFAARAMADVGAWIIGRNMFGPIRGPWPDDAWRGWWGDDPPYHCPVFVLTHHARAPVVMKGGTTFHFITEGIDAALERARAAAQGRAVRLGGGVATIREYLREGLVDRLHLAIAPLLLGSGEALFEGIDLVALGYRCTEHASGEQASHVVLSRSD
jgi:dihydrofolate reductase